MKLEKTRAAVLLSGGMDSAFALYWAKKKFDIVYAISYEYGQVNQMEYRSAQKIADLADVTWIPQEFRMPPVYETFDHGKYNSETYVPGLYMMILLLATQWCFGEKPRVLNLVFGATLSEYPDMKHNVLSLEQDTIQAAFMRKDFNLWIPNLYKSKVDIIDVAKEDNNIMNAIGLSQSCTYGVWPGCNKCNKCVERSNAFKKAEVKDPTYKRSEIWETVR